MPEKKRRVIKYREDVLTMNNGMYCNLLMQILARDSVLLQSPAVSPGRSWCSFTEVRSVEH